MMQIVDVLSVTIKFKKCLNFLELLVIVYDKNEKRKQDT